MRINFTPKQIDEVAEYFLALKQRNSISPETVYQLVPACYGGDEIEDKIIEKYRYNNDDPTHFKLKFLENQNEIIVTFEYCEAFGACTTKKIEDRHITIRI